MGEKSKRRSRYSALLAASAIIAAPALIGVSSSSAAKVAVVTSKLPKVIQLGLIEDNSGGAGIVGQDATAGYQLAMAQINQRHYLGKTVLRLNISDTQSTPTLAATEASAMVTKHYPIVFGPVVSGDATAASPILSAANQVTIFTQAGSDGVLLNKYMFRMTPLLIDQYPLAFKYLQAKGVKTLGIIFDSNYPTDSELATAVAGYASSYGISIVATQSVTSSQADISSAVTSLASAKPAAVAMFVLGGQNPTTATLLRQSGFTGIIVANEATGNGVLTSGGAAANGVTWPSDWSVGCPCGSVSTAFTAAYQAKYHAQPSNWAAEAYDAMWYAAYGLKKANSVNPALIQKALVAVGAKGFLGALGKITVKGNQETTPSAYLVSFSNGDQAVIPAP
jgi:branched-chain amino acid transport system substrate-binding protein